jgi:hypothetical protein
MLPSMAAGLLYGFAGLYFWILIRRTVSELLTIAGMKSGRVCCLAWRLASCTDLQDSILGPDPQDCI